MMNRYNYHNNKIIVYKSIKISKISIYIHINNVPIMVNALIINVNVLIIKQDNTVI